MSDYKVIGIDLAKKKFHLAAINGSGKMVFKHAVNRDVFFDNLEDSYPAGSHFAIEACGGCHYTAQKLIEAGHKVTILKPKDVKPYAKTRQKNDINDALAICKAACDPELKPVHFKSKQQQEIAYLHKSRQNTIQQRIQRSNSLITSLFEFGYVVPCGKSQFAKNCEKYLKEAFEMKKISYEVFQEMSWDCKEINHLMEREKSLDKAIIKQNKLSEKAQILETIPGIGPINASILSNKSVESYDSARDFAASLGLVPKQMTTGGKIQLGGITKQGDRYARTMLIQAGRTVVMRCGKPNAPDNALYNFVENLKNKGKCFNVICVAIANKLARIAYACMLNNTSFKS